MQSETKLLVNKGGRPPKDLDKEQIKELARINCTMKEIAAVMKCSVRTLERGYDDIIKEAKEHGKSSLRRHMWKSAEKGNVTMQIWLSKQLLGMREPEPLEDKAVAKGAFNYWWEEMTKEKKNYDKSK